MPLSPAEEAELAQLQSAQKPQGKAQQAGGLSPEEEQELAQLQTLPGLNHPIDRLNTLLDQAEKLPKQKPADMMADPAIQFAGMVGPESAINVVKSLGSAGKAIGNGLMDFLRPAAQRSEVLSKVKQASQLTPYLESKVAEAKHALNQTQIAPRMNIQSVLADEKMVPLDTSKISGIHPEVDTMIQTAKDAAAKQPYGAEAADHLSGSIPNQQPLTSLLPPSNPGGQAASADRLGVDYKSLKSMGSKFPPTLENTFKQALTPAAEDLSTTEQLARPGSFNAPQGGIVMNFPAKEALKIRGLINKATPPPQFDFPTFKTSQVNAGNHVRSALNTLDPAMGELSEDRESA